MQNETQRGMERQPSVERRLATIMMADVAGFSRMMGDNEDRTVHELQAQREIFYALLKFYRGRIFNTAGDAILAEFPSAVEAVRCAHEIQSALRTRNEHSPEHERMWFRIGINLGDVIVQGDDLLGDGVNVAARIQAIAEPGGICISGSVYDQIQNKLSLRFNMLGERTFKNISRPVRTFVIADADGTTPPPVLSSKHPPIRKKPVVVGVAIFASVAAVVVGGYYLHTIYEDHRVDQLHKMIETERQTAETQRREMEEKFAAGQREREARLEAEKQAARKALEQSEAEKKRLDQELKQAAAEKRSSEQAAKKMVPPKTKQEEPPVVKPPAIQQTTTNRKQTAPVEHIDVSKAVHSPVEIDDAPKYDQKKPSVADETIHPIDRKRPFAEDTVPETDPKQPVEDSAQQTTPKKVSPEDISPQTDPKKPSGKIKITSNPAGAEIYLNGKFMGVTPAELTDIPVGTYTIVLKKEDFDDWRDTVTVKAGKTVFLSDGTKP